MFKSLIEKNEKRSQLSMMAQYLNTCFMISTIEQEYLVNIEKGIVKNVEEGPFVMPSYIFSYFIILSRVFYLIISFSES